jgi:hypothetical protein
MKKYRCVCCGYLTMETRGEYEICPVCYWGDDAYFCFEKDKIISIYAETAPEISEPLDIPSEANHSLTLKEGRENFQKFGACEEVMISYVRQPEPSEL